MTTYYTSLSEGQVHVIRVTLQMAQAVLENEGFENASIQCRVALRTLEEAVGDKDVLSI